MTCINGKENTVGDRRFIGRWVMYVSSGSPRNPHHYCCDVDDQNHAKRQSQDRASATPFALLQACLGVQFNASDEEVRFHHPRLPEFLDEVVVRGIKIGNSAFDVMLTRHNGTDVSVNVLSRKGDGRVTVDL